MALPQQVIEQLGREQPKTPGWSSELLMFSSTVFFLSLFIYLGLAFGYRPYLNSEVKKLKDQIQTFGQQIPIEEQTKIAGFYSQIVNLKSLLANHVFSSQLLGWLEKNTQSNVYYGGFNLNVPGNQLSLSGTAKSMEDMNQQLTIFQGRPEIKNMSINNIGLSGASGLWTFDVSLNFEPGYFYNSGKPIQ